MAHKHKLIIGFCLILTVLMASSVLAITTFTAEETEVLTLSVDSIDLDGDEVTYTFSKPFDENGMWLTDYESAGEYTVTITATDGVDTVVKYVLVSVENKNRAPFLEEDTLTFAEGDEIDLSEYIVDPDSDVLKYSFSEPFDKEGHWIPEFNDAGRYVIEVEVSDSEFTISRWVEIIVEETNQAPEFGESFADEFDGDVVVSEGDVLDFWVETSDIDGDDIYTIWNFDNIGSVAGEKGNLEFDYFTAGDYEFSAIITDGEFVQSKTWKIVVENTNRIPEFELEEYHFSAKEGKKISLALPSVDQDGDLLTYDFPEPFDENGVWVVDFESAGTFELVLKASDGEFETEIPLVIEIENVDLAPSVDYVLETENFAEGDVMVLDLSVYDIDGTEVEVNLLSEKEGLILYEASDLEEEIGSELLLDGTEGNYVLVWDIPYDTIQRRSSFLTNILNYLRLERPLLQEKSETISLEVCSNGLCSVENVDLTIQDTNRAPEFEEIYDQYILETEIVAPYILAVDPDGDIVKYYFEEPLNRNGKWQTEFGDDGDYYLTITASDGYLATHETILVRVSNDNRLSSIWTDKSKYKVNEGEELSFFVYASDKDEDDNLTITLTNGPESASIEDQVLTWTPSFDTVKGEKEASVWLEFTLNDGFDDVIYSVEVEVTDVNQAPTIELSPSLDQVIEAEAGVAVDFAVIAIDADGDDLKYTWSFSGLDYNKVKDVSKISRTYLKSGHKTVTVEVTDGEVSMEYTWEIEVTGEAVVQEDTAGDTSGTETDVKDSSDNTSEDSDKETTVIYVESDPAPTYKVYVVEDWK